jgi:hypothetical protein
MFYMKVEIESMSFYPRQAFKCRGMIREGDNIGFQLTTIRSTSLKTFDVLEDVKKEIRSAQDDDQRCRVVR